MDDMIETMHDAPGIGLAAIQIAEPIRLVVVDVAKKDEPPQPAGVRQSGDRLVVGRALDLRGGLPVDPRILRRGRAAGAACASAILDRDGKAQEMLAEGLLATVLQHEIDHLDGVLFIDHISKLKRDRVIKKFAKAAKRAGDGSHVL